MVSKDLKGVGSASFFFFYLFPISQRKIWENFTKLCFWALKILEQKTANKSNPTQPVGLSIWVLT